MTASVKLSKKKAPKNTIGRNRQKIISEKVFW